MTTLEQPRVFGSGLIALDLVLGLDPMTPVRSWAGGTCGNVLSILAYLGWMAFPIARLNGDPASHRVRADMAKWGVQLDYASCGPTAHTPIIVQEILRGKDGKPRHRFSWSCPKCGQWLPAFKPVTVAAIEAVEPALANAAVFFFDRLSRATLKLAKRAAEHGAVVVLELSSKPQDNLLAEAVRIAHIVKYAEQRLAGVMGAMDRDSATLVEVQTLGDQGLRYRHRFGRKPSEWTKLSAFQAPSFADSCGSGDWCTAGLVAMAASGGQTGLRANGEQGLREALSYGQALAAWNCGFEGARGGMYAVSREAFEAQLTALQEGQLDCFQASVREVNPESLVDCPACIQPQRDRFDTRAKARPPAA